MKLVMEPIEVEPSLPGEQPRQMRWRGRPWQVEQVLERWLWRGRWWLDPDLRGESRVYYRVSCVSTGPADRRAGRVAAATARTLEIFRQQRAGRINWVLSRVVD